MAKACIESYSLFALRRVRYDAFFVFPCLLVYTNPLVPLQTCFVKEHAKETRLSTLETLTAKHELRQSSVDQGID